MSERGPGRGSRVAGRGYQQLRAWQGAHALALAVFRITEPLRRDRRSLVDQWTRSSVSVPANIAEGYNRGSLREYIQYLNIARGSLSETEYYVIYAADTGLIDSAAAQQLHNLIDETGSLLLGLLRSLQVKNGASGTRMVREEPASYEAALPGDRDPRPATHDPSPEAS